MTVKMAAVELWKFDELNIFSDIEDIKNFIAQIELVIAIQYVDRDFHAIFFAFKVRGKATDFVVLFNQMNFHSFFSKQGSSGKSAKPGSYDHNIKFHGTPKSQALNQMGELHRVGLLTSQRLRCS
ncbi:hypothetical protein D3C72_1867310 [compost metagenome]